MGGNSLEGVKWFSFLFSVVTFFFSFFHVWGGRSGVEGLGDYIRDEGAYTHSASNPT